jgi:hypothetical protein
MSFSFSDPLSSVCQLFHPFRSVSRFTLANERTESCSLGPLGLLFSDKSHCWTSKIVAIIISLHCQAQLSKLILCSSSACHKSWRNSLLSWATSKTVLQGRPRLAKFLKRRLHYLVQWQRSTAGKGIDHFQFCVEYQVICCYATWLLGSQIIAIRPFVCLLFHSNLYSMTSTSKLSNILFQVGTLSARARCHRVWVTVTSSSFLLNLLMLLIQFAVVCRSILTSKTLRVCVWFCQR